MKIIEVRDGIIKFETDDSVYLSSFVKVSGNEKDYVAQVLQIKSVEKIGFAKILFMYDDGKLVEYDKTLPLKDDDITEITSTILEDAITVKTPIIAGKTLDEKNNIVVDFSVFNKKTIICADDKNSKNIIFRNLARQFNNIEKNVVIVDTLGTINANKYTAGLDFKLPLNKSSLSFMYEECLSDATSGSKSTIVEIFKELGEYSETVPFVPFETLKSIVDDMVDHSHVFKLLVLKNKLSKFEKLGYFAKNKAEVEKISKVLNSKCSVIDVSKLDKIFQNRYIDYIYEKLSDSDSVVILELSNALSKKTLKKVFDSNIKTIFAAHSNFKYMSDIKNMFDNFLIAPSEGTKNLFKVYSTFLNAMQKNTYLISGEGTNYIPFVSVLKPIEETVKVEKTDDSVLEELIANDESDEFKTQEAYEVHEEPDEVITTINEKSSNTIAEIADNLEVPDDIDMFGEDTEEPAETDDNAAAVEGVSAEEQEDLVLSEPDTDEEIAEINIVEDDLDITPEIIEEVSEEAEADSEPIEAEFVEIPINNDDTQEDSVPELYTEEEQEEIKIEAFDSEPVEIGAEQDNTFSEEIEDDNSIELSADFDLDLEDDTDTEGLDTESLENNIDENISINEIQEENETEISLENNSEYNAEYNAAPEVISLNEDDFGADEIIELNPDEATEDDILIDMGDDFSDEGEIIDEEIKQEVDKVYTTRKDDDFSETDLDFIDELNSEEDTLLEVVPEEGDNILEEITEDENVGIIEDYQPEEVVPQDNEYEPEILETKNSTTPIVPVYDADIPAEDIVESDPIQQGDSVTHVKYGNGIVEKLVKYGSKTLFMINFDTNGRKLLDPLLTEIKKA